MDQEKAAPQTKDADGKSPELLEIKEAIGSLAVLVERYAKVPYSEFPELWKIGNEYKARVEARNEAKAARLRELETERKKLIAV